MNGNLAAILFSSLYAVLNVSGSAIIKYRLQGLKLTTIKEWMSFLLHFQVIVAFGLIFISALVMFKALSTAQFSFIIPIATGINFMFTVCVGYYVFKDSVNIATFTGLSFILLGILILALYSQKNA